jgi:two-component system sensor histidine kinase UhpB
MSPEVADDLTVAAAMLAPVIENLYVQERASSKETERRQFLVRELEASEDERRRIARELHDGVGQTLTGLTMTIDGAAARLSNEGCGGDALQMLQVSRDAAVSALQDIRRVILALRPPALDDMGLFAALEAYARRILREAGIDSGAHGDGHFGLESMRERVDLVRGRLAIHSEPGKGTRVDVRVPRKA